MSGFEQYDFYEQEPAPPGTSTSMYSRETVIHQPGGVGPSRVWMAPQVGLPPKGAYAATMPPLLLHLALAGLATSLPTVGWVDVRLLSSGHVLPSPGTSPGGLSLLLRLVPLGVLVRPGDLGRGEGLTSFLTLLRSVFWSGNAAGFSGSGLG